MSYCKPSLGTIELRAPMCRPSAKLPSHYTSVIAKTFSKLRTGSRPGVGSYSWANTPGYPSSAMVLTEGMAGLLGMTPLAITSSARPAHSLILACPQARVVRTRSISEVRAWTENPEQLYSAAERRGLVERGMLKLPAKVSGGAGSTRFGTTVHGGDGHGARPGNPGDKKPPVPGAPDVARSSRASLRG